jgi:replicative DNA helicase
MIKDLRPSGRIPPYDEDVEKAVIGTLLQFPDLFPISERYIKSKMFYLERHTILYDAMKELFSQEGSFDIITIKHYLKQNIKMDAVGGDYAMVKIMNESYLSTNFERYCMIVLELYMKRECIHIMYSYTEKIFNNEDIADIYDGIKNDLDSLFNINEDDVNRVIQYEKSILSACIHEEAALISIMNKITTDIFYKSIHKDIYSAILYVIGQSQNVSVDSVSDVLKKHNNIIAVSELKNIIAVEYNEYVYYTNFLIDNNNVKVLNDIALMIIGNRYKSVSMLVERLSDIVDNIRVKDVESTNIKAAGRKNINTIRNNADGKTISYLLTDEKVLNEVAFISPNNIVMIGGAQGSGKTRFIIKIMKGILALNKNISLLWFSMEDPEDKILRAFVSTDVGLTDAQMLSKNYKLTEEHINQIEHYQHNYEAYDIEFVTESSSIKMITSKYKSFCKRHKDRYCILIVDNLMLIPEISNITGNATQVEDMVAAQFKTLRTDTNKDGQNSTIFLLHHLTKEVMMKFNKDEAYRPKVSTLKGSTRFADISNIIILLNYIGQHKDIIKEHNKLPDVRCLASDGSYKLYKRSALLRNMLIAEVGKNRDGEIDDMRGIMRYQVDFGLMKFNRLTCKI